MKTINIKGKEYVPVVERVKEAHKLDEKISIQTSVVSMENNRVTVKATVVFNGREFTGHSQAVYSTKMMGDVALEIAETSAVGRALGFANIGLIDGIASADEMRKTNAKDIPLAEEDDEFIN